MRLFNLPLALRGAGAALMMTLAAACATDTTAPVVRANEVNLAVTPVPASAKGLAVASVKAVGRLGNLGSDVTARATIGAEGGTLSLPALGFSLVVPAGAVSAPTQFSVTAIAGRAVAYEFQPHGIRFNVPLLFRQDARFTSFGWGQVPGGAYFPDRKMVNDKNGQATVTEQTPARLNGTWIEFPIWHFSGYLVSCA